MIEQLRRMRAGMRFLCLRWVGHLPSSTLRKFFYRRAAMRISRRSYIYSDAEIRHPAGIVIGEDVVIGPGAVLDGRCGLGIGNNVNPSTGVWIWAMRHDQQAETFDAAGAPDMVSDNTWLSARMIVLPACGVFGGVPARRIQGRQIPIRYRLGDSPATPLI